MVRLRKADSHTGSVPLTASSGNELLVSVMLLLAMRQATAVAAPISLDTTTPYHHHSCTAESGRSSCVGLLDIEMEPGINSSASIRSRLSDISSLECSHDATAPAFQSTPQQQQAAHNLSSNDNGSKQDHSRSDVGQDEVVLIVRFLEYLPAEQHRLVLEAAAPSLSSEPKLSSPQPANNKAAVAFSSTHESEKQECTLDDPEHGQHQEQHSRQQQQQNPTCSDARQDSKQPSASLAAAARWRWLPRDNAAYSHPTDFALLSVPSLSIQTGQPMQHLLAGLPFVRDVHMEKRYTGKLNWIPEGPLADAFSDSDPNLQHSSRNSAGSSSSSSSSTSRRLQDTDSHASGGHASADDIDDELTVQVPAGRIRTRFMMEGPDGSVEDDYQSYAGPSGTRHKTELGHREASGSHVDGSDRDLLHTEASASGAAAGLGGQTQRRLLAEPKTGTITAILEAEGIWKQGYSGKGVKVGVFDTGIRPDHPHIRNIKERTNWTHQDSLSDGLGHGSFVAGVVGSQDAGCPGFAPDVDLHTFKVFTDDQVSYTSWFLDAFNYAMITKVNIINLSIGGPDFLDQPFTDKVLEVTSSGILLVSAIGNDGPLYGTLNNPADQNDVIGVGGIDNWDNIAGFSSRGMSTHELPLGYGRIKPDVMAYAQNVAGSKMSTGCRQLSGTSVASPVVAGAIALLASTIPEATRWSLLNPASMKQALVEGAFRLPNINMYEQGNGRLNLPASMAILQRYTPRASVVPAALDLTDCPYAWPFCKQPIYAGAMPTMFNATLLNGMGVTGRLQGPPVYTPSDEGGSLLHIGFEYSQVLWPWSGYLALYMRVLPQGEAFTGTGSGIITFTIISPPRPGETTEQRSSVSMPIKVAICPPPPRTKRLLFDQYHSLKYPPGYLPRDNLDIKSDILDWHGDHLHTNFHALFNFLRDKGYFIEVLASPFTCFDARQYAALLLVDPEEEYYKQEVSKLASDVADHGISLMVFAEWYQVDAMLTMKFFDDNTRSWWTPVTGGSNVPALNDLLEPFGAAFGDTIVQGQWKAGAHTVQLSHGANIGRMPAGAHMQSASLSGRPPKTLLSNAGVVENSGGGGAVSTAAFGTLGLLKHGTNGGHVMLYGDSNCLDSSHMNANCFELLHQLLQRVIEAAPTAFLGQENLLTDPWVHPGYSPPLRRTDINFTAYSRTLSTPMQCYSNAHCPVTASPAHGKLSITLAAAPTSMCGEYGAAAAAWKAWSDVDSKLRLRRGGGDAFSDGQGKDSGSDKAGMSGREGSTARQENGSRRSQAAGDRPMSLLRAVDVVSGIGRGPWGLGGVQLVMLLCVIGCFLLVVVWLLAGRGPRARNGPRARSSMNSHRSSSSMSPDV